MTFANKTQGLPDRGRGKGRVGFKSLRGPLQEAESRRRNYPEKQKLKWRETQQPARALGAAEYEKRNLRGNAQADRSADGAKPSIDIQTRRHRGTEGRYALAFAGSKFVQTQFGICPQRPGIKSC